MRVRCCGERAPEFNAAEREGPYRRAVAIARDGGGTQLEGILAPRQRFWGGTTRSALAKRSGYSRREAPEIQGVWFS